LSALAERLARLRHEAGAPVGHLVGAAEAAKPSCGSPPLLQEASRLPPLPQGASSPPQRTVGPLPESIRRLLGIRTRALAPGAARAPLLPARPVDRELPGEEIAPVCATASNTSTGCRRPSTLDASFAHHFDTVAPGDVLAFDTETTGLAGGTGTRAFMIGAADWIGCRRARKPRWLFM
jgi:hypothetical protein